MAKLSKSVAAKMLNMSRTTLYRLIEDGQIPVEPDGKIDTTELLRRGFTLHPVDSADGQPPVHGEQLWTGDIHGQRIVQHLEQLVDMLKQQLIDTKQELQDAKVEKIRLLNLLEEEQKHRRLLEGRGERRSILQAIQDFFKKGIYPTALPQ